MPLIIFQTITLVTVGLMVGNELAVSMFVHPQLYSRWDLERLTQRWKLLRNQWDRLHRVRVLILMVALIGLTIASLLANLAIA